MMAKFIKDEDKRLNLVSDFEIQTIDTESGEVIDSDWCENTTFNGIFDSLEVKHRKGLEISVLDYGDELKAYVTAIAVSVKHQYVVLMMD